MHRVLAFVFAFTEVFTASGVSQLWPGVIGCWKDHCIYLWCSAKDVLNGAAHMSEISVYGIQLHAENKHRETRWLILPGNNHGL